MGVLLERREMSARRGAAIAPPSTLDDEHLPRLDDGKSAATKAKAIKPSEDSPLSPHMQKLQELRGRLQKCREINKKEFIEEERIKAGEKRTDDADAGKKRKRSDIDNAANEMRSVTAEDAQWQSKRAKKKAKAEGVRPSPYNEDAAYLSFKKRTKNMPYSQEEYEQQKEKMGEKFYPHANSLDLGNAPDLP